MPKIQNFCITQPQKYCNEFNYYWGYINKKGDVINHNPNGPAVRNKSGCIEYFIHGEYHREDGHAVIYEDLPNRYNYYYIRGKYLSHEEFIKFTGVLKNKSRERHFLNGHLHRDDGPAFITPLEQFYYRHGKLHKKNGPAHISKSRVTYYYNGLIHRSNGPAIITKSGNEAYYRKNKLHRKNKPALINKSKKNTIEDSYIKEGYYINGLPHRVDGPAITYVDGRQEYYLNGKLHRLDGPAIIIKDLEVHYINGKFYTKNHFEMIKDSPSLLNFQ